GRFCEMTAANHAAALSPIITAHFVCKVHVWRHAPNNCISFCLSPRACSSFRISANLSSLILARCAPRFMLGEGSNKQLFKAMTVAELRARYGLQEAEAATSVGAARKQIERGSTSLCGGVGVRRLRAVILEEERKKDSTSL